MRILSIDFDYFQDVTREQLNLYPDGVDNPTALSEIVWAGHYATSAKELNAIGIMENELEFLEQLLLEQSSDVPVMVANSHKHIYNFICEYDDGNLPSNVSFTGSWGYDNWNGLDLRANIVSVKKIKQAIE